MGLNDITIHTEVFPPLTTKGAALTIEEMDTNFIELAKYFISGVFNQQSINITVDGEATLVLNGSTPSIIAANILTAAANLQEFDNTGVGTAVVVLRNVLGTGGSVIIEKSTKIIIPTETLTLQYNQIALFEVIDNKAYYIGVLQNAVDSITTGTVILDTLRRNITITDSTETEITAFDITGTGFDFTIENKTGVSLTVTESTDIVLHGLGSLIIFPDTIVGFSVAGGKATLNYDDKYYYREYAAFKFEQNAARLKPCAKYCITNNRTRYDQPDYEDDGMGGIVPKAVIVTKTAAVEMLVVIATGYSTHTLQAWSLTHPKDYIEWDSDIDETYVNAADCTGKITFRRDENGNEANCDLRGVLLKRYDRTGDENYVWYYDSGTDGYDDAIPIYGTECHENKFEKMTNNLWAFDVLPFDLENSVFEQGCRVNICKQGFLNNHLGQTNTSNVFGIRHINNIWGSGSYSNIFDKSCTNSIFGDIVVLNHFQVEITTKDFSSATHLYGDYNCEIYKDKTDGLKLRYFDSGSVVVVDIDD